MTIYLLNLEELNMVKLKVDTSKTSIDVDTTNIITELYNYIRIYNCAEYSIFLPIQLIDQSSLSQFNN